MYRKICRPFLIACTLTILAPPVWADVFQISPTVTIPGATSYGIPAINNQGAVAFTAGSFNGGTGLYTAQANTLTTIVSPTAGWRGLGNPTINGSGTVAFSGVNPSVVGGVFTGNGGPLTTIVSGLGPFAAGSAPSYGNPSIANNGTVVFVANNNGAFNSGPSASGIYTGNGGPLTTIFSANAEHVEPLDPAISKNGVNIVYQDPSVAFGSDFLDHNGTTTTLGNGGPFDPVTSVGVNNVNTSLITIGSGLSFSVSILTDTNNIVTTVAQAGPTWLEFGGASMNDLGRIAFTANPQPNVGVPGLFVTDGASFDRLVSLGDPLGGSTITSLSIGPEGLNDAGQITFLATLANGQSGVFVASPVSASVPEPSTLALLAVGLIAACTLRHRRK